MIDQNPLSIRADTMGGGVSPTNFSSKEMTLQHDLIRLPTPKEKERWGCHVIWVKDDNAQPLVGPGIYLEVDYKIMNHQEAWDFLGRHGGQFPAIVLFKNDQRASI